MKSVGKYLVGGVIGALVGFLIAPRRAQLVRDALFGRHEEMRGFTHKGAQPAERMGATPPSLTVPAGAPVGEAPSEVVTAEPAVAELEVEEAGVEAPEAVPVEPAVAGEPAAEPVAERPSVFWVEPSPPSRSMADAVIPEPETPVPVLEPVSEAPPIEVLETAAVETPVPETVEAEPVVEPVPAEVSASPVDEVAAVESDLRARIEETRRRIQAELERPFRLDSESAAPESVPAPAGGAPATETSHPESPARDLLQAELGETRTFDYEEMRRRIEETRSRLKAKAFDAILSGETALLSREGTSGTDVASSAASLKVDEEVEQSIESGLSQEEL